ncbi:hypothetical protein J3F83DRAFT_749614 [Trichoderma novae-zelandiae]
MMSETSKQVRCHCGKGFKSLPAMQQHVRDSQNHPPDNPLPSPALDNQMRCSCGRGFKTKRALEQHKRDSPLHVGKAPIAQTGKTASTTRENIKEGSEMKKHSANPSGSTTDNSGPRRDRKHHDEGRASEDQQADCSPDPDERNFGAWSSSYIWYGDVGDDHSLCDKDCGWCGHCSDGVFLF